MRRERRRLRIRPSRHEAALEKGRRDRRRLTERGAKRRRSSRPRGLDVRFVVTNLDRGSAEWLYETLYCARGQAENLIKLHKAQLASDRRSCRSALANHVRLVLHTAA